MRVDTNQLILDKIQEGIERAFEVRIWKHNEEPLTYDNFRRLGVIDTIETEIGNALCQYIDFTEYEEGDQ